MYTYALASYPGRAGEGKAPWYTLFAHTWKIPKIWVLVTFSKLMRKTVRKLLRKYRFISVRGSATMAQEHIAWIRFPKLDASNHRKWKKEVHHAHLLIRQRSCDQEDACQASHTQQGRVLINASRVWRNSRSSKLQDTNLPFLLVYIQWPHVARILDKHICSLHGYVTSVNLRTLLRYFY